MPDENLFAYHARLALMMSTSEAGQLVHVTRRTWELWESGRVPMPLAKQELFASKLSGLSIGRNELVVILADDGMSHVDVVANDNFCGLRELADGNWQVSSLAVNRANGRPYVHRQPFNPEHNRGGLERMKAWSCVLRDEA